MDFLCDKCGSSAYSHQCCIDISPSEFNHFSGPARRLIYPFSPSFWPTLGLPLPRFPSRFHFAPPDFHRPSVISHIRCQIPGLHLQIDRLLVFLRFQVCSTDPHPHSRVIHEITPDHHFQPYHFHYSNSGKLGHWVTSFMSFWSLCPSISTSRWCHSPWTASFWL